MAVSVTFSGVVTHQSLLSRNYSGADLLHCERRAAYADIKELTDEAVELDRDGVGTSQITGGLSVDVLKA